MPKKSNPNTNKIDTSASANNKLSVKDLNQIAEDAKQYINQGQKIIMNPITDQNNNDLESQAKLFKAALEKLEKDRQLVQHKQDKLEVQVQAVEKEKELLEEQKLNYKLQIEELNQNQKVLFTLEKQLLEKEKDLSQRELNAEAGFVVEQRQVMADLEKLREDLQQQRNIINQEKIDLQKQKVNLTSELEKIRIEKETISQEKKHLEEKRKIIKESEINLKIALDDLATKQSQFEREQKKLREDQKHIEAKYTQLKKDRDDFNVEYRELVESQKKLKRQKIQLESEQELLEEDKENLEQKINSKSAKQFENLETKIGYYQEQLEEVMRIRNVLQTTLIKRQEADKRFGNKSPDEILAELDVLRKIKQDLEIKLASKPSDIATEKLAQLENEKEQWEREKFRLATELQELKRNGAYSKIAVTEVETLRDEKEALQVSNDRLKNALEELRKEVSEEIEKSKNTSPFPECYAMDENEKLQAVTTLENKIPDLQKFAEDLRYRIAVSPEDENKRLYYSAQDIRIFLGGLAMSRLHLLEGISGTGKTSLATAFATAINDPHNQYKSKMNKRVGYKLIEVQAGWRDKQDLIGYYNAFEKRFYESEFLQALYEAQCPFYCDRIYIIVLDEMNLSRPEQYFADFLSKLEQESPTLSLSTDLNRRFPALFEDHKTLKIPDNVWFIGTANQDETTLEFADKTYDRAHIMELGRNQAKFDIGSLSDRNPMSYQGLMSAFHNAQNKYKSEATKADQFLKKTFADLLEKKFKIGWGNRLERQINAFIPVVIASGGSLGEATDHLLATKILRKVKNRYDIPPSYLRELKEQIEVFWDDLDRQNTPQKSLQIINTEINRIEPEA